MALTRAQYLAPGGASPALTGQVQGVKSGPGITIAADGTISFNSGTATGAVKLAPPNAYNNYQWPLTAGSAGQVLTTDGSGNLSWAAGGGGSVTSVNVSGGTTGLTVTGGPITTAGTLTLGGVLGVANGGTGSTTQQGSAAAVLPPQAGNAGLFLTTDGSTVSWAAAGGGGGGTVTSVNVSGGTTGLTFSGGPITTSGTITAGGVLAVANGGTGSSTQQGSASNILPTQTGQANKVLTTDGSAVSWQYALQVPEIILAAGDTGTSQTININIPTGFFVTSTLTGNCTFSFTTALSGAVFFTLFLTNDATAGRTIVWPGSVRWPNGGVTPTRTTAAGATDVYTFFTLNQGTTWYGNLAITNYV